MSKNIFYPSLYKKHNKIKIYYYFISEKMNYKKFKKTVKSVI